MKLTNIIILEVNNSGTAISVVKLKGEFRIAKKFPFKWYFTLKVHEKLNGNDWYKVKNNDQITDPELLKVLNIRYTEFKKTVNYDGLRKSFTRRD